MVRIDTLVIKRELNDREDDNKCHRLLQLRPISLKRKLRGHYME